MEGHNPVLLNEVIEGLNIHPEGIYVDLTLGRGGHSKQILKRLTTGRLIAFDVDKTAIDHARQDRELNDDKLALFQQSYSQIDVVLASLNLTKIDGAIMDLGVSSPQFDNADRGFSYRNEGPLDMRMNLDLTIKAEHIVNTYKVEQLTKIMREYGDEKHAYQIAKAIVSTRDNNPIKTTLQLVDLIKKVKPDRELKKKGHPAKQVFQALRIEVNDELNQLKIGLSKTLSFLNSQGRLAVITFHSGEDRIVKQLFNKLTKVVGSRHGPASLIIDKLPPYELVNRKVITPSSEEVEQNPRAKSAKLRIIKRK
jgi:16S rRNA (cytosine1402-N4)-methyltransferase